MNYLEKKQAGIINKISRIRKLANCFILKRLKELDIKGIVPQHGTILKILFHSGKPISITELVKKSGRAKSTITTTVNNLAKHGYIEKKANNKDARSYLIELTEKGRLMERHFNSISNDLMKITYKDIPEKDQEQVFKILSNIEKNLN